MEKRAMRNKNLYIRAINVLLIVAALLYYNQILSLHQELAAANSTIAAMSSQSGQVAQQAAGQYKDGSYQGSAKGFGGIVTVEVTIEDGYISNIEVISAEKEDAAYYNMAINVLDQIIEKQTAKDIDAVSGATYTSNGIINGAKKALGKAGSK